MRTRHTRARRSFGVRLLVEGAPPNWVAATKHSPDSMLRRQHQQPLLQQVFAKGQHALSHSLSRK